MLYFIKWTGKYFLGAPRCIQCGGYNVRNAVYQFITEAQTDIRMNVNDHLLNLSGSMTCLV